VAGTVHGYARQRAEIARQNAAAEMERARAAREQGERHVAESHQVEATRQAGIAKVMDRLIELDRASLSTPPSQD